MSIRSLVVGLAMSAAACGGAAGPAANPAPATPAAPAANRPSAPSAASLAPPAGYLELVVEGVVPTPHGGPAVVLRDASSSMVLPIFVGGTEALSIDLRHAKKRYARPLTHDLFDEVVEKLGGKVVRVQIDGVRDDTFVGSVIVSRGAEIIELDARPSDAIALALGNGVPILVSPEVIKKASIMKDDLEKPPPKGEPPPPTDRREL
jgi:bifunctional DNase/RNase